MDNQANILQQLSFMGVQKSKISSLLSALEQNDGSFTVQTYKNYLNACDLLTKKELGLDHQRSSAEVAIEYRHRWDESVFYANTFSYFSNAVKGCMCILTGNHLFMCLWWSGSWCGCFVRTYRASQGPKCWFKHLKWYKAFAWITYFQ